MNCCSSELLLGWKAVQANWCSSELLVLKRTGAQANWRSSELALGLKAAQANCSPSELLALKRTGARVNGCPHTLLLKLQVAQAAQVRVRSTAGACQNGSISCCSVVSVAHSDLSVLRLGTGKRAFGAFVAFYLCLFL